MSHVWLPLFCTANGIPALHLSGPISGIDPMFSVKVLKRLMCGLRGLCGLCVLLTLLVGGSEQLPLWMASSVPSAWVLVRGAARLEIKTRANLF